MPALFEAEGIIIPFITGVVPSGNNILKITDCELNFSVNALSAKLI